MKVIYRKTVVQQILDAKMEAMNSHREIDKIVLTKDEHNALRGEVWPYQLRPFPTPSVDRVLGIAVEVEPAK